MLFLTHTLSILTWMWAKNVDWPSLMQMEELRTEIQQISDSSGTIGRSKGAPIASHQQISVTVVTEFVRWNEEAISRCNLFSSQVITCFCYWKSIGTPKIMFAKPQPCNLFWFFTCSFSSKTAHAYYLRSSNMAAASMATARTVFWRDAQITEAARLIQTGPYTPAHIMTRGKQARC